MEQNIVCRVRTDRGKNAAGRLRRSGMIPGNLIADGKSEPLQFSDKDFAKLVSAGLRPSSIFTIDVEGGEKGIRVLAKEIQREPVSGAIIHADFYRVTTGKKVLVRVGIEISGNSKGVKAGGAMEHYIRLIKVRTVPESLIDVVKVDITNLDVGEAIHLNDINIPKDWEVMMTGNPIVCRVSQSRLTITAAGDGAKAS